MAGLWPCSGSGWRRAAVSYFLPDCTKREGGYLTTPTERFAMSTYALTRERLEADAGGPNWIWNDNWLGKVRIRGEGAAAQALLGILRVVGLAANGTELRKVRCCRELGTPEPIIGATPFRRP